MKLSILASLAVASVLPLSAYAVDGNLNIEGSVTASTCKINAGTSPVVVDVHLPTVSTAALPSNASTAGRTGFSIALTNCSAAVTKAQTYFESGPTVNAASNNLRLSGSGAAANVELQLLNADASKIMLGNPYATQNSQQVNVTSGAATLNYFAEYYATGAAGAGTANSSVAFSMVYQ